MTVKRYDCCLIFLGFHRVRLLRIDSQLIDGFFDNIGFDLALLRELIQNSNRNALGIDFKEAAQGLAGVATAKAVGSK
ncbi:hypothetical protein IH824_10950 [candidate division KSB1 bacterium]|nr:hypothetical protein [candidate division KSB1 bacterium]